MQPDKPLILRVDARCPAKEAVSQAVAALRRGELVLLPTETVYGVAADPRAPGAVERLFAAKARDAGKPIPFLIDHARRVRQQGGDLGLAGRRLARKYWPGPLTLVVSTGRGFEGFRVPDHRVTLAVLRASGAALRVTSANISGEPPACTAAEAVAALGASASLVLDAGPSAHGQPSTVVKVSDSGVEIIREGVIPAAAIRETAAGRLVLMVCSGNMCRSPMAEHLLRRWLGADSEWEVASAGVSAVDGLPASQEAVLALREKGLDLSRHRSRRLTGELVDAAKCIVVMTHSHRATVLERFPGAEGRVFLLRSFGQPGGGEDVEDPVGSPLETYRKVRDEMDAALPDLVLFLHERAGRSAASGRVKK